MKLKNAGDVILKVLTFKIFREDCPNYIEFLCFLVAVVRIIVYIWLYAYIHG